MAKAKAKSKTSGAAKLRKSGKKAIMLTPDQEEYDVIKRAADLDNRSMASWVKLVAVRAAQAVEAFEFPAREAVAKGLPMPKKGGK